MQSGYLRTAWPKNNIAPQEHREAKPENGKDLLIQGIGRKEAARALVVGGGGGRRKPQQPWAALLVDQRQPHYLYSTTIVLEVKSGMKFLDFYLPPNTSQNIAFDGLTALKHLYMSNEK